MTDCISQYRLIRYARSDDFEAEVNKHLSKGWQLHGAPFINDGYLAQVVIRSAALAHAMGASDDDI